MDIAMEKANSTLSPIASHVPPASRAMPITTGTNTPAILSAILAIGALLALASSTSRIIWLMAVSAPTFSARKWMAPALFSVAEVTLSPTCLKTGRLSPVSADSSTLV